MTLSVIIFCGNIILVCLGFHVSAVIVVIVVNEEMKMYQASLPSQGMGNSCVKRRAKLQRVNVEINETEESQD